MLQNGILDEPRRACEISDQSYAPICYFFHLLMVTSMPRLRGCHRQLSSVARSPNRAATLKPKVLANRIALHWISVSDFRPQNDSMAVTDSVKETAENVAETVKDVVGLGGSSGGSSSSGPSTSMYPSTLSRSLPGARLQGDEDWSPKQTLIHEI